MTPLLERFFPLKPQQLITFEINKQRVEYRSLESLPVTSEQVCFPHVAQVAKVSRVTEGREPETLYLITSSAPEKTDAEQWLKINRNHWGIENGLHQRLDVSHQDDRCRFRTTKTMLNKGLLVRWSNSLFVHWQLQHRKPKHKTTQDFFSFMSANHCGAALRFLTNKRPSLKPAS